jgi:G3E family GTPase
MADALLELKGKSSVHARSHGQKNTIRLVSSSRLQGALSPLQSRFKSDYSHERIKAYTSTPSSPSSTASTFADTRYQPPAFPILTAEDTSYTAKLQAKYTDVILMNKHELVTEREYEECLDHVYTLNEDTPVLKTYEQSNIAVDPDVVFGLDTRLFTELKEEKYMIDGVDHHHHSREIDLIHLERRDSVEMDKGKLEGILEDCLPTEVYRIKGFVRVEGQGPCILNFAFGRWELTPLSRPVKKGESGLLLTVMMARGEGRQWKREFEKRFEGDNISIEFYPA